MKANRLMIHTAAHGNVKTGKVYDTTMDEIRDWHKARGWSREGYHGLFRLDGSFEAGRPFSMMGAGARDFGFNQNCEHYCCSGHGDLAPWTAQQKVAIAKHLADRIVALGLVRKFRDKPKEVVLGHIEIWTNQGMRPAKSCPGKMVDIDEIREMVRNALQGSLGPAKEAASIRLSGPVEVDGLNGFPVGILALIDGRPTTMVPAAALRQFGLTVSYDPRAKNESPLVKISAAE